MTTHISPAPTPLERLVSQFARRYQRAFVLKVVILCLLGAMIVVALTLAYARLGVQRTWVVAFPVALAVAGAAVMATWMRAHWISRRAAPTHLDRVLGLQQRLATIADYESTVQAAASSLYPALMADAAARLEGRTVRVPKMVDRTTGSLLAVLLLILLLPRLPHLRQAQPVRPLSTSASSAISQSADHSPQSAMAPQQGRPQGGSSTQSANNTTGSSGSQTIGQQQSAQTGRAGESASHSSAQPSAGATPASAQGQAGDRAGDRTAQNQGQQNPDQSSPPPSSRTGESPAESSQNHQEPQQTSNGQAGHGQTRQAGAGSDGNQSNHPGRSSSEGPPSSGSQGSSSQLAQQQPGAATGGTTPAGQGADQTALRTEIRQLLQQVSGELQQLQDQMAAQHPGPSTPGTSTDPQLYGAEKEIAPPGTGPSVPIELNADSHATVAPRPGGGTGPASSTASHASPLAQAEQASLSDQPLAETPTARQPVPPEYRSVFDQLNQQPEHGPSTPERTR